jgi:hypothetical protein
VSFWNEDEETYGSVYEGYDYTEQPLSGKDLCIKFAKESRDHVLNHEKFKQIFSKYAGAIGIDQPQSQPVWDELDSMIEKTAREKAEALEAVKMEELRAAIADKNHYLFKDFFRLMKERDLTKYVGRNARMPREILL